MDRSFIDRQASDAERERAKDLAKAALNGQITILEAVRALVSLAHTDAIVDVEARRFIIGMDSETDDLPIGEVRKLWDPSVLEEKDVEIARAEGLYKNTFLEICRMIASSDLINPKP